MKYSKNYCEEKGISTSELTEPQRTLYYIAENMKMDKSISEEGYRHFQMAIKALEQQPSEDCISRESVIEWLKNKDIIKMKKQEENARRELATLPPVTPQRPKGKWIKCKSRFGVEYFKCSECGKQLNWIDRDGNYCNNCGSDNSESTKEFFKEWDARIAEMSGGGEE